MVLNFENPIGILLSLVLAKNIWFHVARKAICGPSNLYD